jgi:hypothetical protein
MTPGFLVTAAILGTALVAYAEAAHKRKVKPKRSPFAVTATPETRARMALWEQDTAKSVPDDLLIMTKLEQWRENPPHGRMKWTNPILVDFKNSTPEFRINDIGDKVPSRYPSFKYQGYIIHGLWATSREPLYGNVWKCSIDYFEEVKRA